MKKTVALLMSVLLLALAGCSSGGTSKSVVGYNYWLLGEIPYTMEASAFTTAQQEAAADLLVNRVVDFMPSLKIQVYPALSKSKELGAASAESYLGQYAGTGGTTGITSGEVHQGTVSYAGGTVTVTLEDDGNGAPQPVTIEYSFDQAEAQALIDFMSNWRVDNFPNYAISTESVTADVVVRGLDGPGSELECMQELHVVASHWVID